MILDRAYELHRQACEPYRVPLDPRLVHPFGTPPDMPPHRWRVSWDVLQALHEAAPPPLGTPKTSEGATLLFGWRIDVDKAAPPGTLDLEPANR